MERYNEYKDSGVQWLGEIPNHWKTIPFRRVAFVKSNLVHPTDYMDYPQIAPDSIEKNSGRILHWKSVAESNIESDNHLFFKGQILYSKIRPLLNKVTIAPFDGLCSADMYPIETHQDTRFLQYYMLSSAFLEGVTNATRDRVKMPKINRDELGSIELCIPPLSEQRSIVSYITDLTSKIDTLASKLQQEIESIKEYKQRLISDVVTGQIKVC
ncbi:MAG: restriction endonuclease subunit S [Prevotella sp.]|nr:restriction endonuclease subunit S [Prevotella sp.]